MKGLTKAVQAHGGTQKAFAIRCGVDHRLYSKAVNGECNLTPQDFRAVCNVSGLPPNEVATLEEVDYGILPLTDVPQIKKLDNRKRTSSLHIRFLPKQRKQLDKDLVVCGYATVQGWVDQCARELHALAEQKRGTAGV